MTVDNSRITSRYAWERERQSQLFFSSNDIGDGLDVEFQF